MRNAPDPGEGRGALVDHRSRNSDGVSHHSDGPQAFPIEIAKFWKNRQRRESVHVDLSEYEGHKLINVRVWETGSDGIDRPTKKGIALGIGKLPELSRALLRAEVKAHEIGLLQEVSSC